MYGVESIKTRYGTISDVTCLTKYENGICKDCMIESENILKTKLGTLIPKYSVTEARTKHRNAVEFYPSGALKSVYLEERTSVTTSLGKMDAEMLTFYESGELLRLFPRYGQISGFWSEEEEKALLLPVNLDWCGISGAFRVSCYCFYKSGKIKSLTFYPGEEPVIWKQGEKLPIRIGIAFYESGEIRSIEPAFNCVLQTPIGEITAYDSMAYGIHGDANSLEYYENGKIKRLKTISEQVNIQDHSGNQSTWKPLLRSSQIDPEQWEVVPIQIEFFKDEIVVTGADKSVNHFLFSNYMISVSTDRITSSFGCTGNCSSCSACTT